MLQLTVPSTDITKQVYVALSDMITWGVRDEEVDLSMLYDLLRQQLHNPNDTWVQETLEWWNRCVSTSPSHPKFTVCLVKFSLLPPTKTKAPAILGTRRAQRREK